LSKGWRTAENTKANLGGITHEQYWYIDLGVSVQGVNYKSSSSVTAALLATAASHELKWNAKKVGLLRIDSLISQGG